MHTARVIIKTVNANKINGAFSGTIKIPYKNAKITSMISKSTNAHDKSAFGISENAMSSAGVAEKRMSF